MCLTRNEFEAVVSLEYDYSSALALEYKYSACYEKVDGEAITVYWILKTGLWDDTGIRMDTEVWND